jgi:hypothetical protein
LNPLARKAKSVLRGRRERRERAPAATILVSFPKSGRTWLRAMLGRALCRRYGLPEALLLDTYGLTRAAGLAPAVFSHDGSSHTEARHWRRLERDKSEYRAKRVLFLARDPRDVVVSGYFQATRRRDLFRGGMSDFVRDPRHGIRKVMVFYQLWSESRGVPRSFRAVSYEALHADPAKTLRGVLEFLGAEAMTSEIVSDAVEFSRFENLKRMEAEGRFASSRLSPGDPADAESFKVRKGRVGGHEAYLDPADLAYCNRVIEELACPLFSP